MVIDEQGRLFGKVNLIDAAAIAAIGCVIPVLVWAYATFARSTNHETTHPPRVLSIGLDLWILPEEQGESPVEAGEALVNELGQQVGRITHVEHAVIPGERRLFPQEIPDPPGSQIMSCVVQGSLQGREASFGDAVLKAGETLALRTERGPLSGMIRQVYLIPPYWVTLRVETDALRPELAQAPQEGDVQRDANGKIVARLKGIVSQSPLLLPVAQNGEWVMLPEPSHRTLAMELEVYCMEEGGQYFFYGEGRRAVLKLGSPFTFRTARYDVNAHILRMSLPEVHE